MPFCKNFFIVACLLRLKIWGFIIVVCFIVAKRPNSRSDEIWYDAFQRHSPSPRDHTVNLLYLLCSCFGYACLCDLLGHCNEAMKLSIQYWYGGRTKVETDGVPTISVPSRLWLGKPISFALKFGHNFTNFHLPQPNSTKCKEVEFLILKSLQKKINLKTFVIPINYQHKNILLNMHLIYSVYKFIVNFI